MVKQIALQLLWKIMLLTQYPLVRSHTCPFQLPILQPPVSDHFVSFQRCETLEIHKSDGMAQRWVEQRFVVINASRVRWQARAPLVSTRTSPHRSLQQRWTRRRSEGRQDQAQPCNQGMVTGFWHYPVNDDYPVTSRILAMY
jgi:hypothetical protein